MSHTYTYPDTEVKEDAAPSPLDRLRGDLDSKVTDRFPEGTVVRWKSGGRYTYAALKAGGRWWITGTANYYGGRVFDYDGLLDILGRSDVSDISAALNNWESL